MYVLCSLVKSTIAVVRFYQQAVDTGTHLFNVENGIVETWFPSLVESGMDLSPR